MSALDRPPIVSAHAAPASAAWWWLAVAAYTVLLPGAIAVWNMLASVLGGDAAGYVPGAIVALVAVHLVHRGRRRGLTASQWALLAAAGALAAALLTAAGLPSKRIHVPEYMLLAWLLDRALSAGGGVTGQVAWVATLGLALGAVDETLQGLIPSRFFAMKDVLVNGGAALAGALAVAAFAPARRAARATTLRPALGAVAAALAAAAALGQVHRNLWAGDDGLAVPAPLTALVLAAAAGAATAALWRASPAPASRALAAASTAVLVLLAAGGLLGVPFK